MGKRGFDIVFSAVLFVLALPIIGIAAVGVAWSLRAWPFFIQERVGKGGRPFRIIKLRTLPASAPRYADKYTISEIPLPWFPRLLRKLHIDELPQLALVLTGRMSLVGPRPELQRLTALLDDAARREREAVRPGCTGLWQVSRDADRLIAETPSYDRFYAAYASWRLDLYILIRTVRVMSLPNGRIALEDVPSWAIGDAREVATPASVVSGGSLLLSMTDAEPGVSPAGVNVAS